MKVLAITEEAAILAIQDPVFVSARRLCVGNNLTNVDDAEHVKMYEEHGFVSNTKV